VQVLRNEVRSYDIGKFFLLKDVLQWMSD
jgi:hypothetical protein